MLEIGDFVLVNKSAHSSYVGKGTVEAICNTQEDIYRYFHEEHPFFSTYVSWLNKKKAIYIVNLEKIGLAGFLSQEITKLTETD